MKQIIYLLLIGVLAFSCQQEKGFVINGKIDVKEASIRAFYNDKCDTILVKNYTFKIKGEFIGKKIIAFFIKENKSPYPILIYGDNAPMQLSFKSKKGMYTMYNTEVKGSKDHTLFKQLLMASRNNKGDVLSQTKQRLNKIYKVLKENPKNEICLNFINSEGLIRSGHGNHKLLEKIYNLISENNPNKKFDKLKTLITKVKGRAIGTKFIDYKAVNTKGDTINLLNSLGKNYTLVDFWASWCAPCRKENPNYKKAMQLYKDKGFKIIAISRDSNKDKWLKAIKKDQLQEFLHLNDSRKFKETELNRYGLNGIPDNFLLNTKGEIIANTLRGEELLKRVGELYK